MNIITLDFETYYSQAFSLSKVTTEEYIRSPEFEVIGVSVKTNDEPAEWFSGTKEQTKRFLDKFNWAESVAVAHNAMFDMAILSWVFDIRPKRIADTLSMARALGHGSVSLAALVKEYKLGEKGDEVINALGMRRLDFDAGALRRYAAYCKNDTELTYKLFEVLAEGFPLSELKLIDLTIRMFTEPVLELDKEELRHHLKAVKTYKENLLKSVVTSQDVLMSNQKFAAILERTGVTPPMKISPTTGKETFAFGKNDEEFKALLEHKDLYVQALVAARLGVKSTLEETRTERFIGIAERGKLPIPLRYYAAHTGRWGGDDKVNMQNLPRNSPLKYAMLAPEGYMLIDSDSSQIEARTLAWLAGQHDLVEAFDRGEDVYRIMAAKIYNKREEDVTKDERFVGKTTILGCGYGMGAAKFKKQLKVFCVDISEDEARTIIEVYRRSYPAIPALWREAGNALEAIIENKTVKLGRDDVLVVEGTKGIRLPNGLYLKYPNLRKSSKDGKTELVYDTKKGKTTVPNRIYGGKCLAADTKVLTSRGWVNITSVTMADLLWDGLEWVKHSGLTYQGEKVTTILNGVRMTPDHEVLTDEGWRSASSCEGLHRSGFWLPDGSEVCGDKRAALGLAVPLHLRKTTGTCGTRRRKIREKGWNTFLRLCVGRKEQDPRHVKTPRVLGMEVYAGSLSPANSPSMEELRWPGRKSLSSLGRFFRGFLGGYGANLPAGAYVGPQEQQRKLHAQKLPLGYTQSPSHEHPHGATSRYTKSSSPNGYFSFDPAVSVAPEPVYDIVNAGPRSRFVVQGSTGPFIVHNCVENICQALARIIIGEQMLLISKKYKVAMTVHDAIACVVPEGEVDTAQENIEMFMRVRPAWAQELPLNCEAGAGKSYGDC